MHLKEMECVLTVWASLISWRLSETWKFTKMYLKKIRVVECFSRENRRGIELKEKLGGKSSPKGLVGYPAMDVRFFSSSFLTMTTSFVVEHLVSICDQF